MAIRGQSETKILNAEYGWKLRIDWKILNQSYENGTSNVLYEVKFICDKEAYAAQWSKYSFKLKTKTASGGYKEVTKFTDTYGEHELIFDIGENTLLTWQEQIEHFDVFEDTTFQVQFSFTSFDFLGVAEAVNFSFSADIPAVDSDIALISCASTRSDLSNDYTEVEIEYLYNIDKEYSSIQFGLSFDKEHYGDDIRFRDVALNDNVYHFTWTEAELEQLYSACPNSTEIKLYVVSRGVNADGSYSGVNIYDGYVSFYIFNTATPALYPEAYDVNPVTLALTGNNTALVRSHSTLHYKFNAYGTRGADIAHREIYINAFNTPDGWIKGTLVYEGLEDEGEIHIPNVDEFNDITFAVEDTRGLRTFERWEYHAFTNMAQAHINYNKLTCNQEVSILMKDEYKGVATLNISGEYFNGDFNREPTRATKMNELKLYVRHTQNDGSMGDWVELTDGLVPIVEQMYPDDTSRSEWYKYNLDVTISGFDYNIAYTFQCKAVDLLSSAETEEYTVRVTPVFDWSEEDFNFNVPVIIQNDLEVIGAGAFDSIVAPAAHINTLTVNQSLRIQGKTVVDYIIEQGTSPMGSNGTWYWSKWASGKAECYGCRNYGNMAVLMAYGDLYQSPTFQQELPNELFADTPEVIDITLRNSSNYGGWVVFESEEGTMLPDANTTGGFCVVRPANATLQAVHFSFNIIGRWK